MTWCKVIQNAICTKYDLLLSVM